MTMSLLQMTWKLSLAVQAFTQVLCVLALIVASDANELLRLILGIELVINAVQLLWYGLFYFLGFKSEVCDALDPRFRYIDWVFTTPTMLLSTLLLLLYWYDHCTTLSAAFDGNFIAALLMTFFFNFLMLLSGGVVAFDLVESERQESVLYLGFVPFIFVFFAPIVYLMSFYTTHGMVLVVATIIVWGKQFPALPSPFSRVPDRDPVHAAQAGTASQRSCIAKSWPCSACATTCWCAPAPTPARPRFLLCSLPHAPGARRAAGPRLQEHRRVYRRNLCAVRGRRLLAAAR